MIELDFELTENLKNILEDRCDLCIKSLTINNDQLIGWKVAGIIKVEPPKDQENSLLYLGQRKLRILLSSGENMWFDKFELAIISTNLLSEVMVFINPSESDMYLISNYEDIITVIKDEFISSAVKELYSSSPLGNSSLQYYPPSIDSNEYLRVYYDGSGNSNPYTYQPGNNFIGYCNSTVSTTYIDTSTTDASTIYILQTS